MIAAASDILDCIDAFAPWSLAEEWDNPGLLAGRPDGEVRRVLCALDLTNGLLREAREMGADMLVLHHPILFRPRRNLREDDPEGALLCKLVRSGLCLAAAHTNYDFAPGGVNDVLAEKLGLRDVRTLEWGGRAGKIPAQTLKELAEKVRTALGEAVRVYGREDMPVDDVTLLGGSGGDFVRDAAKSGADVYVTGEIGYHKALDALDMGMAVLEAGHRATELPAVEAMADALRRECAARGLDVQVNASANALY